VRRDPPWAAFGGQRAKPVWRCQGTQQPDLPGPGGVGKADSAVNAIEVTCPPRRVSSEALRDPVEGIAGGIDGPSYGAALQDVVADATYSLASFSLRRGSGKT
jgi:hypothetical protein